MKRTLAIAGIAALLSACNTATPYPNYNPIEGARVSANPYERGSRAYCEQYARQTAGNAYETRISRGETSFGEAQFIEQRARSQGRAAYERCLARGTN